MSAGAQHLHVRQDNKIVLPVRMQGVALLTSIDASSNRLLSPEDAVARRKALPALARLDLRANPAAAHPRYRRVSALDAAPAHTDTDFCEQLPRGHASVHPLNFALAHLVALPCYTNVAHQGQGGCSTGACCCGGCLAWHGWTASTSRLQPGKPQAAGCCVPAFCGLAATPACRAPGWPPLVRMAPYVATLQSSTARTLFLFRTSNSDAQ